VCCDGSTQGAVALWIACEFSSEHSQLVLAVRGALNLGDT
jgi:hypothetical protein